ncbi:MAG: hypothetical protein M0C28_39095 [Candidatus Moduliflexus flocculans]|nr:hypothetical protein [Candidatus Moduliflexus flocculans]
MASMAGLTFPTSRCRAGLLPVATRADARRRRPLSAPAAAPAARVFERLPSVAWHSPPQDPGRRPAGRRGEAILTTRGTAGNRLRRTATLPTGTGLVLIVPREGGRHDENARCRSPPSLLRSWHSPPACKQARARPSRGRGPARSSTSRISEPTGLKDDLAQETIQKAVDACAEAGGGNGPLPARPITRAGRSTSAATSGSIVEAGATRLLHPRQVPFRQGRPPLRRGPHRTSPSKGAASFDGERRLRPAPQGRPRGRLHPPEPGRDGEARPRRSPRAFPKPDQYGKLVLLVRCTDVRIAGVSLPRTRPSWTMHPVQLRAAGHRRRLHPDQPARTASGPTASTPTAARTSASPTRTIETGDDALVFYSMDWFGPALPCENITVTNCRLTLGLERDQVLRRQHRRHPQRDHRQLRHHRLQPRHRLHDLRRRARSRTSSSPT